MQKPNDDKAKLQTVQRHFTYDIPLWEHQLLNRAVSISIVLDQPAVPCHTLTLLLPVGGLTLGAKMKHLGSIKVVDYPIASTLR